MANPIRRGADPRQLRAGSRLSREAHDRFDGSGEGKFLPATLLIQGWPDRREVISSQLEKVDSSWRRLHA